MIFSQLKTPLGRVVAGSAIAGIALSSLLTAAHADVRYTSEMRPVAGDGSAADTDHRAGTMTIRTTTMVKDMHERVETDMNVGPMKMHTVKLTLCDTQQSIQLDPALKIYTTGPIDALPSAAAMQKMGKMPRKSADSGSGGEGKVINTFHVTDLGTEKVAEVLAHHYMMDMRTQSSGCAGDSDVSMKMETWVAPIKGGLRCPERFAPSRTVPSSTGSGSDCHITYEMKGDLGALKNVYGGMVVRMKIYNKDKVVMEQDLRDYSLAKLDEALFTVPSDYKEVSESEFQKAQSKAMMKSMTHGLFGGSGDSDSSDNQDNKNSSDAPPSDDQPKKEEKKKHGGFKLPGGIKLPF